MIFGCHVFKNAVSLAAMSPDNRSHCCPWTGISKLCSNTTSNNANGQWYSQIFLFIAEAVRSMLYGVEKPKSVSCDRHQSDLCRRSCNLLKNKLMSCQLWWQVHETLACRYEVSQHEKFTIWIAIFHIYISLKSMEARKKKKKKKWRLMLNKKFISYSLTIFCLVSIHKERRKQNKGNKGWSLFALNHVG